MCPFLSRGEVGIVLLALPAAAEAAPLFDVEPEEAISLGAVEVPALDVVASTAPAAAAGASRDETAGLEDNTAEASTVRLQDVMRGPLELEGAPEGPAATRDLEAGGSGVYQPGLPYHFVPNSEGEKEKWEAFGQLGLKIERTLQEVSHLHRVQGSRLFEVSVPSSFAFGARAFASS